MLLTMHVPELGNLSFRFQIKPVLYAFKYIHLQAMNQSLENQFNKQCSFCHQS